MDTPMGMESEYAISVVDKNGNRKDPDTSAQTFYNLAMKRFPHLKSSDGQGIFLPNGGKFYVDVHHPEWATPECLTPQDLVRYTLAGDRIMALLTADFKRSRRSVTPMAFRGNTSYCPPATYGCHRNFQCRRRPDEYAGGLLGHLVSRILIVGSGGFDPINPGVFTLSPRSHFLTCQTSRSSTSNRPILNLRDQPLDGTGRHRLHLICADALGSEKATYLRSGTTALVIAVLDSGAVPPRYDIDRPSRRIANFSRDASLTAKSATACGGQATALEIQECTWHGSRAILTCAICPCWLLRLSPLGRRLDLLRHDPDRLEFRSRLAYQIGCLHGFLRAQWDCLANSPPMRLGLCKTAGARHQVPAA